MHLVPYDTADVPENVPENCSAYHEHNRGHHIKRTYDNLHMQHVRPENKVHYHLPKTKSNHNCPYQMKTAKKGSDNKSYVMRI